MFHIAGYRVWQFVDSRQAAACRYLLLQKYSDDTITQNYLLTVIRLLSILSCMYCSASVGAYYVLNWWRNLDCGRSRRHEPWIPSLSNYYYKIMIIVAALYYYNGISSADRVMGWIFNTECADIGQPRWKPRWPLPLQPVQRRRPLSTI